MQISNFSFVLASSDFLCGHGLLALGLRLLSCAGVYASYCEAEALFGLGSHCWFDVSLGADRCLCHIVSMNGHCVAGVIHLYL